MQQQTTRKNLLEMLKAIQEMCSFNVNYDGIRDARVGNEFNFKEPLEVYGLQTRYTLLSNFCTELCFLLLK